MRSKASKLFVVIGILWLVLSTAYFGWNCWALSHNYAAIVCGWPKTNQPSYATCFAQRLSGFSYLNCYASQLHWLWILLPACVLLMIGLLLPRRRAA